MLRTIVEENGYQVVGEAGTGTEAISLYETLFPDLTLLDINMPEMDGLEALKIIREIDPAAQVIIVSAMGYKKQIAAAMKGGAKNFIVKPFEEKKVIETIAAVFTS